jgi:hypothetical protein
MNGFEYIRDHYRVPARRGGRVKFRGEPGRVVGTSGPHLRVRLDSGATLVLHPTESGLCYLPPVDPTAALVSASRP